MSGPHGTLRHANGVKPLSQHGRAPPRRCSFELIFLCLFLLLGGWTVLRPEMIASWVTQWWVVVPVMVVRWIADLYQVRRARGFAGGTRDSAKRQGKQGALLLTEDKGGQSRREPRGIAAPRRHRTETSRTIRIRRATCRVTSRREGQLPTLRSADVDTLCPGSVTQPPSSPHPSARGGLRARRSTRRWLAGGPIESRMGRTRLGAFHFAR